ncbi:MAG: hypothetical protein JJE18_04480 [Eubacteriaceae bacterium]|nr:hypothetical protein [Eubacteriaceae bacterium]
MKNSLIINVIQTVLSAIFGILILNQFNIFDYLNFVPSEIKYEVGMTVYFAIIDSILTYILEDIKRKYSYRIECTFYCKKNEPNLSENPIVNFQEDVTEIAIKVSVEGDSSQLREMSIVFNFPDWLTVQSSSEVIEISESTHSCVLRLNKFIPDSKKKESGSVYSNLVFIKDTQDIAAYSFEGQLNGNSKADNMISSFLSNRVEIKS